MKRSPKRVLKQIRRRRAHLLKHYDEEQLHQLRVNVRRLRSQLRFDDSPDAWQLRREWGYLVSQTNALRDWDTLGEAVNALPADRRPDSLVDAVSRQRKKCRREVLRSLNSEDWDRVARNTRHYLEKGLTGLADPAQTQAPVEQAHARVTAAWTKAQASGSNRAWHKVRIAVKDLRYSLESQPGEAPEGSIEFCKALQDQLGHWHDTVVHRELLRDIEQGLACSDPAAIESVKRLRESLRRSGNRRLGQARNILEKDRAQGQ